MWNTDGVAWSVGLSVMTQLGQRSYVLDRVQIPTSQGQCGLQKGPNSTLSTINNGNYINKILATSGMANNSARD